MIQESYALTSEVQRVAYDLRSLVFISEDLLTNWDYYTTADDFSKYLKEDIE